MNQDAIERTLKEASELVQLSTKLSGAAAGARSTLGADYVGLLSSVATRGGQLIRRLYGEQSQYFESWQKTLSTKNFSFVHSNWCAHVFEMAGILQAVEHELKSGLLVSVRGLLQAEIFADFLDMAEHLLREGYKDASAVIAGAVLEDGLRKIAVAKGVDLATPAGKPLTMDPLNVAAAKAGAYGPLVQKQVTTWANLRNDAAHGHFDRYDKEQVAQMLMFVQKFCADHVPAVGV